MRRRTQQIQHLRNFLQLQVYQAIPYLVRYTSWVKPLSQHPSAQAITIQVSILHLQTTYIQSYSFVSFVSSLTHTFYSLALLLFHMCLPHRTVRYITLSISFSIYFLVMVTRLVPTAGWYSVFFFIKLSFRSLNLLIIVAHFISPDLNHSNDFMWHSQPSYLLSIHLSACCL